MRKLEIIFWIIIAVLVVFLLGYSYSRFGLVPLILEILLSATGFLAGARFARLSRRT